MTVPPVPTKVFSAIVAALSELPRCEGVDDARVHFSAEPIWIANCGGQTMETVHLPSRSNARKELDTLASQCERLSGQIGSLHSALAEDLFAAGAPDLAKLQAGLRNLARATEFAQAESIEDYPSKGRPPLWRAGMVTAATAQSFTWVTGSKPTFSSDHGTSEISGEWPDLLERVFTALGIAAEARRQAREYTQKNVVR